MKRLWQWIQCEIEAMRFRRACRSIRDSFEYFGLFDLADLSDAELLERFNAIMPGLIAAMHEIGVTAQEASSALYRASIAIGAETDKWHHETKSMEKTGNAHISRC